MIVRDDSIAFMAILKHARFYIQTVEIPLPMLEAAATSASTTHVSPTKNHPSVVTAPSPQELPLRVQKRSRPRSSLPSC
jgi:hypothetical protein